MKGFSALLSGFFVVSLLAGVPPAHAAEEDEARTTNVPPSDDAPLTYKGDLQTRAAPPVADDEPLSITSEFQATIPAPGPARPEIVNTNPQPTERKFEGFSRSMAQLSKGPGNKVNVTHSMFMGDYLLVAGDTQSRLSACETRPDSRRPSSVFNGTHDVFLAAFATKPILNEYEIGDVYWCRYYVGFPFAPADSSYHVVGLRPSAVRADYIDLFVKRTTPAGDEVVSVYYVDMNNYGFAGRYWEQDLTDQLLR